MGIALEQGGDAWLFRLFPKGGMADGGQCLDLDPVVVVDCARPHDAEVLATKVLTQDDARDYDGSPRLCRELLDGAADVVALTSLEDPNAGDVMACVALVD